MIEKRITQPLLEAGTLALTAHERADLSLPEHSTTIEIELDGETFGAQWSGRSRQLSGDMLTERLQDYGQVGGLLRLDYDDHTYRLRLLPPGSAMQVPRPTSQPAVVQKPPAGTKAARRRATVDRQFHSDDKYDWGPGDNRTIGFLTEARVLLTDQLKAAGFDPFEMVELRLQGEELATLDDFEELLAVDVANVDRMPHQAAAARHALSRLRGRAILADEVGLGKTIEAGLAVKELTLRGLAKRVIVLCPAPLRDQWREEMNQKFDMQFDVAYSGLDIGSQDKLIVSLALGTRHIGKLAKTPWDIVIVDEAHRAAGAGARKRRELVTALTTECRYAFFLTATPVQNDLLELYRLVELLRPGTFRSEREFRREFMTSYDPRRPTDPAALRSLISNAMIRTTRAQAGVDRVTRKPIDIGIDLGPRERELYALSTDLLRNVMTSPGDTMRRRSLALRLTASPFSMGTTALRMAERHPDEHVRKVLTEIGHFAMDISGSAREDRALDITHRWLKDHGRVLIFTQHTDTVTGLLRRMELEGLRARAFHGSMSPSERASTIAAFRSGEAPIMVSTDSGAEGQNLQFCNCVLNYDLPWNPMRIEQRIGRVDRLTQPRNEVFVANLYARGTIDQSVYQLLADKLRMFELLFGQVTTILGELDDSKSATFESRVLDALFAESDSKMQELLSELGTELADARERASTLIAADSGLSKWMTSALDHREGLTKEGSTDLAPEIRRRARIRQRRVQAWVRRVLKALDAQILHDTGDGEGAFLTAQLGEEVADELGGRTLLHLAFDRHGLENHPDAELCAVGSPVFDELLGLLRVRGDMHATVPVIPEDLGPSPFHHAPTITLVRRRLVPSGTWSGQATFRARIGEAEITEHIITAEVNGTKEVRLPRRPLQEGESLPAVFDEPAKVIAAFESSVAGHLEKLRRDRAEEVERQQALELERIRRGYQAQIDEAPHEDKARLRRALYSEERRLTRRPDVRARAKLLALTLDEDDWVVEETWAGPNGVEATLTYEWGLSKPPTIESDATRAPIKVLALCSNAHWIDIAEFKRCDSCNTDLCQACGDVAIFANCPLCDISVCGSCRTATGGLCLRCGSPERAPELDREFAVGWRLNQGVTLLLGERTAELMWPDQSDSALVVRDEDVDDPNRIKMRSYAVLNGLPADTGLVLNDRTGRPSSQDPNRLRLRTSETVEVEFSVAEGRGSSIDASAIGDLPEHDQPVTVAERVAKIAPLLEKLREAVPPPTPPTVVVTHRSRFTNVYLGANGLIEQVSRIGDDGALQVISEREATFDWLEESLRDPIIAQVEFGGLEVVLERRNDAVLIRVTDDKQPESVSLWMALPDGVSPEDQFAWFDLLRSQDIPGGRVGRRPDEPIEMAETFPSPSECQLIHRSIQPVAELQISDEAIDLIPADRALLVALGCGSVAPHPRNVNMIPTGLSRALLKRTNRTFSAVVRSGFEIHEKWQGHGAATHQYRVFDGQPIAPMLDDLHTRETNFGVCRDGHFYRASTSALCTSCRTWACRACDGVDHRSSIDCPSCDRPVCRRCLEQSHTVVDAQCLLCHDRPCPQCGRDPEVLACSICGRSMCSNCRVQELCPACSELTPASAEQLESLPLELAIAGSTVLAGADQDAMTILINRGDSVESVVIRDCQIERWVAFGQTEIDDTYQLRLAASQMFKTQVAPALGSLEPETAINMPHVLVDLDRQFYPAWSIKELGASGRSTRSFTLTEGNLARLVAEDFPAVTRLPSATDATPSQVERAVASVSQPHIATLEIRWHRVRRDVAVCGSGILTRILDGTAVHETMSAWHDAGTAPSWVTEAWAPVPTVLKYAASGSVEVVIVAMASLLALGVRIDNRSEWYGISGSPEAAVATTLSRWMGIGDTDEVATWTDPNKITLSAVTNATNISRKVHPLGAVKLISGQEHPHTSLDALTAWLPTAQVTTPELGVLPPKFRTSLEQLLKPTGARTELVIGAHVEETVTVENGHIWNYEMRLMPGQTDARRFDSATRVLLKDGVICREGHFVAAWSLCKYCDSTICTICTDNLVSCDCCQATICRRCVREPHANLWLCPACATMRRPTRSEARRHGRFFSRRGLLVGVDTQHTVVVEHVKHRWMRQTDHGEKCAIAAPAVANFLSERLALRSD
ncbi:helicase-related protein [Mycobacterium shimoidei]|uniref:helicase-related protein n=1 Tax=Mycobacterium shimoidei TaxID=29313 RepID=UPI000849669B|nr:helicase-related protein [Mycobacterium shimoidei]MCV7261134.1 DEAD/DEAH box helicase family protein [Mycobacterium shimoidei]ODR06017.1 helicase [Mycobacterium shimoidei]ORW77389.1 helicase [Mycobacterium shimoidei]